LPGVLLTVGVILATAMALAGRRHDGEATERRTAIVALAIVAAVIAVVYVITPGSAQGLLDRPFPGIVQEAVRWTMPSAVIAGGLLAWLLGRVGRWAPALELAAAAAVADGLRRSFHLPTSYVVQATAVVAGLAAITAAIIALRRRRPLRAAIPARAAFIGISAVLVGGGVTTAGYFSQRRFSEHRYRHTDPTNDWVVANAPAGHRVGLAGDFPGGVFVAPLFGARFDNYVTYVGSNVHGMLQQYHSQEPFLSDLKRKHLDLVIVGRGLPHRVTVECWTLRAGFVPIVRSDRQVLLAKTVPPGMRRPPLPSCR
jgi:hypothetical protein